jgi:glyoxalase family protein
MLLGFHHITALAGDAQDTLDHYTRVLQMRLVKRTVNQDAPDIPHWFWAAYDGQTVAPHSAFTLFGFPPRGRVARGGVGQTHHVAFRASSDDQQAAWRDHLLSLGVQVSEVMDRDYFRSIYFRAPDGLLLEIATDGPGFMVDEPRGRLGTQLQLPAWLTDRREEIEAALPPLR